VQQRTALYLQQTATLQLGAYVCKQGVLVLAGAQLGLTESNCCGHIRCLKILELHIIDQYKYIHAEIYWEVSIHA
jgi:hypothetical protein